MLQPALPCATPLKQIHLTALTSTHSVAVLSGELWEAQIRLGMGLSRVTSRRGHGATSSILISAGNTSVCNAQKHETDQKVDKTFISTPRLFKIPKQFFGALS